MGDDSRAKLIDTHCHLDFPEFDLDRDDVIRRAKDTGIGYIINIGSSLEGSRQAVALSKQYTFIYATVGIHPHEADKVNEEIYAQLKHLAKENKVVAIGEIGLDYYKNYSLISNQKKLFKTLAELAKDLGLPLIIHCRQAEEDVLEILKPLLPHKIVLHCFSGNTDFLQACLDLGFFISFTLNITYKKAQNLRTLVKIAPLERIFLETDAPFLPPESLRGRRNEPAYVKILAEEIARIKDINFEEVAAITTANAQKFFNLR
ncbi:MAG: TatD family hydrolase [Candidatus Omnitrophica bacterium]|nr:TatD family hydrolase [Candidatus Omnitrophota bacterium]MCM8770768.1 TatD family hydrolase [Candidatus Omnitrophota bacterium]